MSDPSHKHLYTVRRDPESDPPLIGMPVLAEWKPNQFVPAFRSYPNGWVEVRSDGHLVYDNCVPLTWAEYPRTAPTAGLLAAAPDLVKALEPFARAAGWDWSVTVYGDDDETQVMFNHATGQSVTRGDFRRAAAAVARARGAS